MSERKNESERGKDVMDWGVSHCNISLIQLWVFILIETKFFFSLSLSLNGESLHRAMCISLNLWFQTQRHTILHRNGTNMLYDLVIVVVELREIHDNTEHCSRQWQRKPTHTYIHYWQLVESDAYKLDFDVSLFGRTLSLSFYKIEE